MRNNYQNEKNQVISPCLKNKYILILSYKKKYRKQKFPKVQYNLSLCFTSPVKLNLNLVVYFVEYV